MKYLYTFFAFIFSLGLLAQPTTNAPDPDKLAENVVSIYSDAYTDIATNYQPNWGQTVVVNQTFTIANSTNNILLYQNTPAFQGTDLTHTNCSTMEYLHVDIWVETGTDRQVKISPIDDTGESLQPITLTPGSWSSVDLPKSAFAGMNWAKVKQLKVDAQFNGDGSANATTLDIYLDNIYFWKEPSNDATDATLSDLTVDGTTVNGFQSDTTSTVLTYRWVQPLSLLLLLQQI